MLVFVPFYCGIYHILFIYSPVDGYLDFLYFLPHMNNAVMNIQGQVFV